MPFEMSGKPTRDPIVARSRIHSFCPTEAWTRGLSPVSTERGIFGYSRDPALLFTTCHRMDLAVQSVSRTTLHGINTAAQTRGASAPTKRAPWPAPTRPPSPLWWGRRLVHHPSGHSPLVRPHRRHAVHLRALPNGARELERELQQVGRLPVHLLH